MDGDPSLNAARRAGRKDRWLLAAIVLLAFGLRLAAVLQYEARHPEAEELSIDEASYDRWAREIAGGDWIGDEVFFQEPLYPYSLGALYAVFGPLKVVARIVQCALWAATAALVGLLARKLFGRAAGWIAALGIALYGPGLLFPSFLLKENLFLPLLALFALLVSKSREAESTRAWFALGAVAGLGALLRGNLLVLLPVFAVWPVLRARRRGRELAPALKQAGAFLAASVCVLLPVALRNLAVGGVLLPTTSGAGTNLYAGNRLDNPFGRAGEAPFIRGIPEHEAADWRREAERRTGRRLDPAEVSAYWRGETLRSFREHPGEHLAILWRKLRLSLGRYEVPDNHCLAWDARYVPLARLPWPGFGLLGAFGLSGLVLLFLGRNSPVRPRDPGAAAETAVLFLLYLATIVLTVTSDRARLPLAILLVPFAGWAIVWAARAIARWNQEALSQLALAGFLGVAMVHLPVLPAAEITEDQDERDYNLAVRSLRDEAGLPAARSIAERLVRDHPRSARARILLAEVDVRSGGSPENALAVVEPLAREPSLNVRERFHAESLCAWIHLRRGDLAAATASFRRAREFDPDAPELREGLARALLGTSAASDASEGRRAAEEALELLRALPERRGAEILIAQAEFLSGRAILAEPPSDEAERELGQSSVQAALDRLRALADAALPSDLRRQSRELAGAIQLYRRNWQPAENHFRAALELGGGAEAELGLVQALLGALEDGSDARERAKVLAEARRRVESLPPRPGLEELRLRIENLR